MDNLAINRKVAKLLGRDQSYKCDSCCGTGEMPGSFACDECGGSGEIAITDIFTNPADQIATVTALGEKRGLTLAWCRSEKAWEVWEYNKIIFPRINFFDTYQEALQAAVEAA